MCTRARRDGGSGSFFAGPAKPPPPAAAAAAAAPNHRLLHHFSIASCGNRWYHTPKHLACLLSSTCSAHKQRAELLCITSNEWCLSPGSQQFLHLAANHSSLWRNNSCARIIPTSIGMFWGPTQPTRRCAHACVRAFDRKAGGFRRVSHPISPGFQRFQKISLAALLLFHTSFLQQQ